MIKLFRTSSFYRPLSIMIETKNSLNDYELNNILFFNEKGIIIQIGSGFFDDDKEREFKGTCIRKLKVDFNMKDNFIIKSENSYSSNTRYDLYIYEKNVDLKFLGKEQRFFGDIYSHWQVDDYDFWKYEKTLKDELYKLNDEAEKIIDNLKRHFGYNKKGADKIMLNNEVEQLKKVNEKIMQEVVKIKNYKI